jgi:hypothetical protein
MLAGAIVDVSMLPQLASNQHTLCHLYMLQTLSGQNQHAGTMSCALSRSPCAASILILH